MKELTLDALEAKLDEVEAELLEMNSNSDNLHRTAGELVELQLVLEKAGKFFEEGIDTSHPELLEGRSESIGAPLLEAGTV